MGVNYTNIEVQVSVVSDLSKGVDPEFVKSKDFKDLDSAKAYRSDKINSGFQATILGTKKEGTEIIKE